MFNFFRRKPPPPPEPDKQFMSTLALSDGALITVLRNMFEQHDVSFSSLFLVGYANWSVEYNAFLYALKRDGETAMGPSKYTANVEGYVQFLAVSNSSLVPNSDEYEWGSRRILYMFLASLLQIVHARARKNPELWDSIAEIWVALLPGAQNLRDVINRTSLWRTDETLWFSDIKTEMDGERYCLAHLAPTEIRNHDKISTWQEKDLPPDIIAQLRADERLIRGE